MNLMKKDTKIALIVLGVILIGVIGIVVWSNQPRTPGKLDAFAACLKSSGAVFYGAFWCPHCQAQKAMFGSSASLLPYIECSNPDGQSQNAICDAKGIQEYPTWVFKDGSRLTGTLELSQLAQKTGCALPQ